MEKENIWTEVFGLTRRCFSQIDPTEILRFTDGTGSHAFLKFEMIE